MLILSPNPVKAFNAAFKSNLVSASKKSAIVDLIAMKASFTPPIVPLILSKAVRSFIIGETPSPAASLDAFIDSVF